MGNMSARLAIVGSVAARYHLPDFPREAVDLDVISPEPVPGAETHWYPELQAVLDRTGRNCVAPLDVLYTLKVSHAYWDVRWDKTAFDIIWFQKNTGAQLDLELHTVLYKLWEQVHGVKPVNLDMSADEFFNAHVTRIFDHDSIHATVAYGDAPLYERLLADGAEVMIDGSRLEALSEEEKLMLAREEIYATALERWVIPSGYTFSAGRAYARALKLTVTSLTKGRFARFIADHLAELSIPDVDYVGRHRANAHMLIRLEGS